MHVKNIALSAALVALAEQALALHSHRHVHRRDVDKRAISTDWVTVWQTVYATEGNQPMPAATEPVVKVLPAQEPSTVTVTSTSTMTIASIVTMAPQTTGAASSQSDQQASPSSAVSAPGNSPGKSPPFSSKKGLAYNDANIANTFGSNCPNCGWGYNWASSPQGLDPKFSFVPMLWGDQPRFTDNWDADAEKAIANNAVALFSFNEPDNIGQANMTAQQAAASHAKYMNKYAGKALIGSPSVTNSGSPGEGIEWLKNFMSACESQQGNCQVDFCNVHWYSEPQFNQTLFEHLDKAHDACGGKPVWLTEFAPLGNADASNFLQTVIPKLESLDYLHGFAYFMTSPGSLMASPKDLSSFGTVYAQQS